MFLEITRFKTKFIICKSIYKYSHLWIIGTIFLLTAKGHIEIADTEYSIRTALSIVENGTLLIDPPDPSAIKINFPDSGIANKIYSPYGIGLSLIFIPIVIICKILSLLTQIELRLLLNFLISFYNIPFALLGLFFFQKIVLQLGASKVRSIFMTFCLGICTCYWKYTVTDFSEIVQACFLLAIILTLLEKKEYMWYRLSFYYSILVLLKLTYFVFFPFIIIFFITENIKNNNKKILRNFLKSASFFIPTCILIALLNFFRFNNIFESGYGSVIKFSTDYLVRDWFAYLFSYERGVLTFNPILILTLAGFFYIPAKYRRPMMIIGLTTFIWFITMCLWVSWQGGYCWGNRLLVPIVPLLLLPMVFLKIDKVWMKILLFLTLFGSMIVQLVGSFTKIHEIIEIKVRIKELTDQNPDSQLWRAIDLFFLKIKSPNAEYLASSFGVESTEVINLTSFSTFHGFNLWFVHLLNHIGLNTYSHYAGILLMLIILALCFSLFRIFLTNSRLISEGC